MTEDIVKYLSILNNLGYNHIKTINGFLQKPYGSSQSSISILPSGMEMNNLGGGFKNAINNSREMLYQISLVLERMDSNQFDDIVYYQTKQLRESLDHEDKKEMANISNQLKAPIEVLESIGRIYQSYLLFEMLTAYLSEEHLSKISDALTSVFPVPLDSAEDSLTSAQTITKTQNYLIILQKLQQLFAKTPIDSLLHLQQQITQNENHMNDMITPQLICETLDMKSDEFFLATSLKALLQIDEHSLTTLVDSFPRFQSLQLIQLSLLPLKNIYEILDLKSNLCSLSSIYQVYPTTPAPMTCQFKIPDPEKKIELSIVEQPPDKAVYRRNVKPHPSVIFDGDSKLLNGNYYVNVTLLRCNNFKEEHGFLNGNKLTQIGSSRMVTFRKLKILVTSHQQGESLFCFRFDLRRYNSDPEQNPNDFELIHSINSNPICVLSHSTQLKHNQNADLPKVVELVPLDGPCVGGTRVALLGANFTDTPGLRIKFDNVEVIPEYHGQGTLTCHAPEHAPGTVQVKVSNSPKVWSTTFANFTYKDEKSINTPSNLEINPLALPRSVFGLNFSQTLTNFIIKDASMLNLPSNPGVIRNNQSSNLGSKPYGYSLNYNSLDNRGYGLIHYSLFESDNGKLLSMLLGIPDINLVLQDKFGNTPLHYALSLSNVIYIKALLSFRQRFIQMLNIQNNQGQSPLHYLILHSSSEIISELLPLFIQLGSNVNLEDINGSTPLHYSTLGSSSCMETLLKSGSNIYSLDYDGDSALHYAVREGSLENIKLLLSYSKIYETDIQSANNQYFNDISMNDDEEEEEEDLPLHLIKNDDEETALHLAISIKSDSKILNLLINNVHQEPTQTTEIPKNIFKLIQTSSQTTFKDSNEFFNSIQSSSPSLISIN